MIRSRLGLVGIRASGHHGARPGEKEAPQEFVVDLELTVEVADDAIGATGDYRALTDRVRAIVERESFDLIETMAARIAEEIAAFEHVVAVAATVHKPEAAGRLGIDRVSATVRAGEGDAGG
jgi:dihydroneopterin aldolase